MNTFNLTEPPRSEDLKEYLTIEGMLKEYPSLFKKDQLRWLLRNRANNKLGDHICRVGRLLYIHVPGFISWMRRQK